MKAAPNAERCDAVMARTGDHIDLWYEHSTRVFGDPVADGVVDHVSRRAAQAQQLNSWSPPIAYGRDVLVSVTIYLRGTHDHVSAAGPHDIEDRAKRHVHFDDLAALRVD